MTFEEFLKHCSFDYNDYAVGKRMDVTVIFSSGYIKDYDSDFVLKNMDLANKLTAQTLYDYLKEQFKDE